MYAGHFAAALALKAARPATPTWALALASGVLDLAYGALVIAGVEGAEPDYAASHRLQVAWSHSLLVALLLGAAAAMLARRWGRDAALLIFAAVLSHWLLDVAVHAPDMRFWPGGAPFGFRPLFGPVSGWFETLLVIACAGFYALRARRSAMHGRYWGGACAVLAALWGMGLAA